MLIDDTRCGMCHKEFDPPRVVKWGEVGIDLRSVLYEWEEFAEGAEYRYEIPICGQCWEPLCGDIGAVSMHPQDIALLPRAKPPERLSGGLDRLLGIPLYTSDTLEPGTVQLRYRGGKTAFEVVAEYKAVMTQLDKVDSTDE